MKNLRIIGLAATFSLLALSACVSDHNSAIDTKSKNDLVFTSEPEPVKGKLDVYNSMARTVKYNVDGASQNLSKKIYSQNPNQQPKDIIRNITNTGIGDNMPLYDSANVLEFAIIYATANLQEKPSSIEAGLMSNHLSIWRWPLFVRIRTVGLHLKRLKRLTACPRLKTKFSRNSTAVLNATGL